MYVGIVISNVFNLTKHFFLFLFFLFSRRLTMHLANGAIKDNMIEKHNSNIGREHQVNHTEILRKHSDTFRMLIHEALHIKFINPDLNRQDTGSTRILLLYA